MVEVYINFKYLSDMVEVGVELDKKIIVCLLAPELLNQLW